MHEQAPKSALYGQVRVGRVSAVGKSRHTVEVKFEEVDGFVSWDLHVLARNPGDYALPASDTPVLCLLLDGRLGVGFVLGCFYTEDDAPPLDDDGKRSIVGDDLRLGAADASDKVALAPKVNAQLDALRAAITAAKNAVVAQDGGLAAFTALDTALKPPALSYTWPDDVDAENVSAK